MYCDYCEQSYNKKYYKTHLKTKKHLKNYDEDNNTLKEGMKLLCKSNGNIIKDYINNLEYVEEYQCEVCKKVYEDDIENECEERDLWGKYIAQCFCGKCFCFECWENYYITNDNFYCLKKKEMCVECFERDDKRDEIRDEGRKMINIMVKKEVIEMDDYDSDQYCSEDENDFPEWNQEWNQELENYDSDDYD